MLPDYEAILLADDSPDDLFLMKQACKQAGITNPLHTVNDGQEVMDYLDGKDGYADRSKFPKPSLVVLDIKMPKMSGLETLTWIRNNQKWQCLPVIMLTASVYPGDVREAYRRGANAFHVKPTTSQELAELAAAIKAYWLRVCEFPK